jgi:hypothetical protein
MLPETSLGRVDRRSLFLLQGRFTRRGPKPEMSSDIRRRGSRPPQVMRRELYADPHNGGIEYPSDARRRRAKRLLLRGHLPIYAATDRYLATPVGSDDALKEAAELLRLAGRGRE